MHVQGAIIYVRWGILECIDLGYVRVTYSIGKRSSW